MNRITIVTLGVDDPSASRAFYEAIGWSRAEDKPPLILFPGLGYRLCLYPRDELAAELGRTPEELGVGSALLTVNWRSDQEVAQAFSHALDCGATAIRLPALMPWGGYSCYWSDPDGHVWEYARDPALTLAENGQIA